MSERNETWADIVAEIRGVDYAERFTDSAYRARAELRELADRIEAAANREGIRRDKTSFHCGDCAKFGFDCDAGDVDGNEDCLACENFVLGDHFRDAAKMVGNAAALREAMENLARFEEADLRQLEHLANRAIDEDIYGGGILLAIVGAIREGKKALAAQPRNCDRPECSTPKGAAQEWAKHCSAFADKDEECAGCIHQHQEHEAPCVVEWLLAPAPQEGGGHADA